jgi:UDP-2,3-diacylglucosamine hydrolase
MAEHPAPSLPPLPRFVEVAAQDDWQCIELVSDVHLNEASPGTWSAFERYLLGTTADAVLILGDLFEVWVGDDARHEDFESRCAELLEAAASRCSLAFMPGNRDFLVGSDLLQSCGVQALSDPAVYCAFGQRVLLTHGDALCIDDLEYQAFRRQVRSLDWQEAFLARPLPVRREMARDMRERSRERQRQRGASDGVDVDTAAAVQWMHMSGTPLMVHGHTHRPGSEPLAPGYVRHVLSDWHAEPDGQAPRAQVLRWTSRGLQRVNLLDAGADPAAAAGPSVSASSYRLPPAAV